MSNLNLCVFHFPFLLITAASFAFALAHTQDLQDENDFACFYGFAAKDFASLVIGQYKILSLLNPKAWDGRIYTFQCQQGRIYTGISFGLLF